MTCYAGRDETLAMPIPKSKEIFFKNVEARFLKSVKKNGLISENDRVLVACSGGKDSMTLLYLMSKYFPKQTTAMHMDQGILGVTSPSLRAVKRYSALWGVPLKIVSFKKEFKNNLDEMIMKIDVSPCYIDGVLRRYLLNKTARESGFTKVATGHNLDDEAQSIMMNIFMGDINRQARLGYSTGVLSNGKFVQRIKPLRDIYEKETKMYAKLKEWSIFGCNCPYGADALRRQVRRLLDDYEKKHPQAKRKIVDFYDSKIIPKLRKEKIKPIGECPECGEPSSQKPCKACQLIEMIKK